MENLISKQFLNSIIKDNLNESVRMFSDVNNLRESKEIGTKTSFFLSHKHSDKEYLKSFIFLLKKVGISVYVDWMDNDMPKNTNGYTATLIKKKIKQMNKFVLLATENAIQSKWCNWELGFGDANKFPENIAILPITDKNDNEWSGNEYLQIYPVITAEYQYIIGSYYVEYKGSKIKLEEWLKR